MADRPEASVVIPSYNSRATLLRCLETLDAQSSPPSQFEVVVVLDGSTDGSAAALAALTKAYVLRVIALERNVGRAAALNRGIAAAAGEIVIVTDSDILTGREFVTAHLAGHGHGDVVLGPIPLAPETPPSFLADGVADWAEEHARFVQEHIDALTFDVIQGANISMRRATFERLGGYREDLRRTEDWHLGKKILEAGLRVVWAPAAIAEQIYDKTVPACNHDFYIDGRSQVQLVREFPELRARLKLGQYRPASLTKRCLRPLVMRRRWLGELILGVGHAVLERARRRGLHWRLLRSCQGVLADALYFRGVYEAAGGREPFAELVLGTHPRGEPGRGS